MSAGMSEAQCELLDVTDVGEQGVLQNVASDQALVILQLHRCAKYEDIRNRNLIRNDEVDDVDRALERPIERGRRHDLLGADLRKVKAPGDYLVDDRELRSRIDQS